MSKDTIKTVRLSQEAISHIDTMPGNTFTARLECVIGRYFSAKSKLESELLSLEAQVAEERAKLSRLRRISVQIDDLETALWNAREAVDALIQQIEETHVDDDM